MAQRVVIGAATDQSGKKEIVTTKVSNTVQETTKLRFKLTAAADYPNTTPIVLKPGAARNGSSLNLDGKLTFVCTTGFASYADMIAYYKLIATNVYQIVIQTDDTDNYEDNQLIIREQEPSGKVNEITIDLSDYRVSNGSGFSDKIVLEQTDFNQIYWPGSEILLKTLKPGTSMTITQTLQGWNKVQELSAVQPNVIA